MTKTVTVTYGAGNSVTREVSAEATIEEVINNENLEALLGYSVDSVEARISGSSVSLMSTPDDGARINLITKVNAKG